MKQVKNIIFLAVLFISFFVIDSSVNAQSVMPEVISATATGAGGPYNLEIYIPENTTGNLPAVVFFPGNGETGTNRNSLYTNGPLNFIKNSGWRPNFIVIGAQPNAAWPGNNFTNTVLNTLVSNPSYRIDQNKLYLTGLSGGAAAIDTYIKTATSPVPLAAVVPMSITYDASCGNYFSGTDYLCGNDLKWGNQASWGFAGSSDSHFAKMKRFFDLMIAAGYESRWTTYSGGHSGWNAYYNPTYTENINGTSMNIYDWMLQHSAGGNPPPSNTTPTSNAGTDQTITLPTSSVTLTGSGTDSDGTISSYSWTKVSSLAGTITSPSSASTTITGLVQGTHTFRLTVTDNGGLTASDDVVVVVSAATSNSAPVVNAGADQTITLPTSSVTLTGSATDPEGDSMTYIWTKVSGPSMTFTSPSSLSTSATGLTEGTYSFWLTATDSQGAVNADQIIVIVNAASGGGGGGTSTINGLVTRYTFDTSDIQWGSTTSEIRDTAGSAHGDSVGLSSANAVTGKIGQALNFGNNQYVASSSAANFLSPSTSFTVSSWINTPTPAGNKTVFGKATANEREVQLLLNSSGSVSSFVGGANNTATAVLSANQWIHLVLVNDTSSGLSHIYTNGALTKSLAPGSVTAPGIDFLIGARRNSTNTDSTIYFSGYIDDVRIYNRALSQSEISSIYNLTDISPITPPTPTDTTSPTTPTNLSATGTTQTQTTLSWTASTDAVGVSGYRVFRNGTQIATTATPSYTATGLTASTTYSFTVSAYDAAGNVSTQSTAVSVTTASTTNTAPTANAGADQTITLPTSSVTLTGSGTDSDGTISSYSWSKVSSLAGTITSTSSASTTITGLAQGTHTFRLTVTDNGGLTASDDVVIIVNPVVTTGGNKIFQIDFGGTPSGIAGWNDVLTLTTNTTVNLVDSTNSSTGSSLQITNGFNAANYVGTTSSSLFPSTTTSDSFFLGTFNTVIDDNAQLLISGLNNGSNYKFTFYGSRVAGDGLNRTGQYNIGSTTVELNATDNVNNVAVINGAVPSNGAITININRKSSAVYGYLGLIKIEENAGSVQANQAPTSNAGTDQTITLPTSSVTLTGSGTDSDGTISSYSWSKVSALAGTITSPSSASTTVTGLAQGTHTFRLTVTDNGGLTASDDVVVVVSAAGVPTMCTSKKIVILGSSTAAGTGASPSSNSWAAKFTSYFNSLSVGNSVDNLAFSGYTTYNILPTGSTVPTGFTVGTGSNITAAISRNPCAIIINMPSNDEANNISIATQQSNWEIIATSAQNANIPIWVTTTQPREWPLTNQGRLNLMTMRDWLTTRFGANSIDFWTTVANADGTVNPIYNSDGVHVNNLGHDLFYNRVRAENIPGTTASTTNTAPTANAGTDRSITLPTSSVTLTGSGTDSDGTISSYSWTKVSSLAGTITSASSASTTVTGLAQGTHTFRLTVTDNGGLTASDDVVVVVSAAGVCKSVSSAGIIPSGGADFWFMGNFNTTFNLNPCDTVVLQAGTYGRIDIGIVDGITFTNNGQVIVNSVNFYSGSKNVKLLGNGTPGIQYGIKINGANSFATYWKATGELEIAYVEVVGTAAGIEVKHPPGEAYTQNFANLKIHDNYIHDHQLEGMYIGMDNLSLDVLINAEIYNNIVRNSGNDGIQTRNGTFNIHDNIVDNVALSPAFPYDINGILIGGNTKNSTIHNNTVSRVPGTAIFNNGWGNHTITCNVISSNQPGIFTKNYEFTTEDLQNVGFQNFVIQNNTINSTSGVALQTYYANNGSSTSTNFSNNKTSGSVDASYSVTQSNNNINVVPSCSGVPTNTAPTSNAGTDQTITLPTSSVTLTGSGTDSDGTISSYSWTKISGTGGTITSASSASTIITGLSAGSYTFRLTVTDNGGLTASDDVVVVVNIPGFTLSAGTDQSITLPTSSVNLNTVISGGTSASSYSWTKTSGPSSIITSPSSASTTVTGLTQGIYDFQVTVNDTYGRVLSDTVRVTVNGAIVIPNVSPVANAGTDRSITLPTSSVTLTGSGTDSDGTISSYSWTKVSSLAGTITSASSASTTVTGLAQGTHTFRLTVTDNNGALGTDDVMITVNTGSNPVNVSPVANAGTDRSITLPTSSVTLTGSGTDSDGTISSYSWTKISGTGGTITSASSASTIITGLSAGSYTFRLSVTDDDGVVGYDEVLITVNPVGVNPVNSAPIVNSGSDTSTTASSVVLTATASDSEGDTMTYNWSQVFGISTSTISSPNSLSTTISGLRAGTYTFSFSATDSLGATSTDTINVVVISTSSGGGGGGGGGGNGSFVNPVAITPTSNTTQTSFPELQVPANTNPSNSAKVNVVKLNVRSSPINGQVLNTIPKNTEVTVLSQNGSWSQILLSDGTTGWVFGSYITNVTNTSPSVSIPTSSSATVITTKLNVRSSPSTGKVLTSVSRNTIVNVISQNGSWANVSLSNGITGWVYAPYIKAVNTLSVGSSISVSTKLLNIRSSPIKGSVVKTVSQGSTGKIIDGLLSSTTWVNVLFDDGTTGYVYKAYLKAK